MTNNTFRFLVANDSGESSQEWRVWSEGSELYVGARLSVHEYKASFHSSGQCHVGISSQLRAALVSDPTWTGKSRLFSAWTVDEVETESHRNDLLEILIPDSYLDAVEHHIKPAGDKLHSVPGHITSVVLIKTRLAAGTILTSAEPGFRELHRIHLDNGFLILVIRRRLPESPEYHRYVRTRFWSHYLAEPTAQGRTYGRKEIDQCSPNVRAMLWDGTNSQKYWHEVSARKVFALGPPEE